LTDEEVALAVEDFFGVNSQVTSEDIKDQFYKRAQNYYERKLGELQPIGGAEDLFDEDLPSNVVYVGKATTLKDRLTGKKRLAHFRCDGNRYDYNGLNAAANVSISWETGLGGTWGQTPVGITNAFVGCDKILLVAVGFGVCHQLNEYTASLPVAGDSKVLRVTISSPFTDPNITGIQIYARVKAGYTGGNVRRQWMYVNYIDLVEYSTAPLSFDIYRGPITLGADPGAPQTIGSGNAAFTATGTYNANGRLTPGKTYYVACMSQYLTYQASYLDNRCYYKNNATVAVTLGAAQNSIVVSLSASASSATGIAIGTHPHLMIFRGVATNAAADTIQLNDIPWSGAVVNVDHTGATTFENVFHASKIYTNECLGYYDSTYDRYRPVFFNAYGGSIGLNSRVLWSSYLADNITGPWGWAPSGSVADDISGWGDWSMTQAVYATTDLLFMTPRAGVDSFISGTTDVDTPAARDDDDGTYSSVNLGTNLMPKVFQTDGRACGRIIPDYNTAKPPKFDWIMLFKESLVGLGGPGAAYNKAYFTEALNPYNWGTPESPSTAQYVQVEGGGEGLVGGAVYTNTTGTQGPIAQLVLAKPNSLWILSDLPAYTSDNGYSGSNPGNDAFMTQLSGEIGSAGHETFQSTDIGLITTSIKGVWLIRESGEPTPIGEEIRNFLIDEDPSLQAINTRYWHAVFHDGHYKLNYSVNGELNPTKELWLNIYKMKQMKGQPCWNGPHTQRSSNGLRFSYSEGPYLNQNIPARIGTTGYGKNWGTMDNPSVVEDFENAVWAVQKIVFSITPGGGSIKFSYGGYDTVAITAADVQVAANVQTVLRQHGINYPTLGTHRCVVTGTFPTYYVELEGIASPTAISTADNTLTAATTVLITVDTAYVAPAAETRTYIFETRDYPLGNPNMNKLFTRTYYRMKIDEEIDFEEITTVLNELGEESETQTRTFEPLASHTGGSYTAFLTARQKIHQFFPTARLRGETIRKKLTYSGPIRHAISGLSLFFRPERRRIG
jgi:hypothetical protein